MMPLPSYLLTPSSGISMEPMAVSNGRSWPYAAAGPLKTLPLPTMPLPIHSVAMRQGQALSALPSWQGGQSVQSVQLPMQRHQDSVERLANPELEARELLRTMLSPAALAEKQRRENTGNGRASPRIVVAPGGSTTASGSTQFPSGSFLNTSVSMNSQATATPQSSPTLTRQSSLRIPASPRLSMSIASPSPQSFAAMQSSYSTSAMSASVASGASGGVSAGPRLTMASPRFNAGSVRPTSVRVPSTQRMVVSSPPVPSPLFPSPPVAMAGSRRFVQSDTTVLPRTALVGIDTSPSFAAGEGGQTALVPAWGDILLANSEGDLSLSSMQTESQTEQSLLLKEAQVHSMLQAQNVLKGMIEPKNDALGTTLPRSPSISSIAAESLQ